MHVQCQSKLGNKSHNLPYCSSVQSVVVYNFTEIKCTFLVPFWDYLADCLWVRGIVSICLIKKGKYDWFMHEWLLLHWLIFLLYLPQFSVAQNILLRKQIFLFLNLFIHFLHPLVLNHLRSFVTVKQPNFTIF